MLPDNVLLEIFDFYREDLKCHVPIHPLFPSPWKWKALTQVCRRWRSVIFGSPRRLDLRVVCTEMTPARTSLDIWPPFPITATYSSVLAEDEKGVENIIAAIEHHDRISQIHIDEIKGSALDKLADAMREPLPNLTHLYLMSTDEWVKPLPETFLGGSAPPLQVFTLWGIPFPTFPRFILSATHLVYLGLYDIPSWFPFPEEMATCLAALPCLEGLSIGSRHPQPYPLRLGLPPPTRLVLPALTYFHLGGISMYFEQLIAQVDTPVLSMVTVTFFTDTVFGDIPQLRDFLGCVQRPKPIDQANMKFGEREIGIVLGCLESPTAFRLEFMCKAPDWEDWGLSPVTQLFRERLPLLSRVEELGMEVCEDSPWVDDKWRYYSDMDTSQWLRLFHLFVAVRTLFVFKRLVPLVESALQELVGARTMEVLPALRELFLEGLQSSGPMPKGIDSFLDARELAGHPVEIYAWVPSRT
jgi:hypothetical protein